MTYRRESEAIYPPVDVESFHCKPAEDYALVVSEMVAYKRIDTLVRCCSRCGRRLKIAGAGTEYRTLRAMAAPNVEFLGRVSDEELRELYLGCRFFLLPGEEDFGGQRKAGSGVGSGQRAGDGPVFRRVFYDAPEEDAITEAIARLEEMEDSIRPAGLQAWARQFSEGIHAPDVGGTEDSRAKS
jgi:glycosyltransferase involved in cell wall biosynthesis